MVGVKRSPANGGVQMEGLAGPLRAGALWRLALPTWPASSPTAEPTQDLSQESFTPCDHESERQVTRGHQSPDVLVRGENKRKQILEMVTGDQMGQDISAGAGERDAGPRARCDATLSADASPEQ